MNANELKTRLENVSNRNDVVYMLRAWGLCIDGEILMKNGGDDLSKIARYNSSVDRIVSYRVTPLPGAQFPPGTMILNKQMKEIESGVSDIDNYIWIDYIGVDENFRRRSLVKVVDSVEDLDGEFVEGLIAEAVKTVIDEKLTKAHKAKEYGHEVTIKLERLGANKATINAFWAMKWKWETTPEEFMELLKNVDVKMVRICMRAKTNWILDAFNAPWKERSMPRRLDLVIAIAKARKIAQADDDEFFEAISAFEDERLKKHHKLRTDRC